MKKSKLLILISSLVFVLAIGLVLFADILEAINEKHTITLQKDVVKISYEMGSGNSDYIEYDSSKTTIYADTSEVYDLIAVSADNSDGFVIGRNIGTSSYDYSSAQSNFKSGTQYYLLAVFYHSYNSYVNDFYDLELLNNEFRHNVVNDDLNIGNVTDFYNQAGEYIGNSTNYNLINGLYDYKHNAIYSITNGTDYIVLSNVTANTYVDLTKYHRNDFYVNNSSTLTITNNESVTPTYSLNTETNEAFSGYYDYYGRKLDHLYFVDDNGKEWNYVFTENGIVINGILNNASAPKTINLKHSYYDNGVVVDDAYKSKVFKNIYVLQNITTMNDLTLIMPCNIHLLNNNITLNDTLTLKHYYHSSYKIDNMDINGNSGNFISNDSNKFINVCPNAVLNISNSLNNIEEGTPNLLDDVIEFANGYFVDYILKDKYYQVYDSEEDGKKLVSYDSVNLIDGLYTSTDMGATLVPVTSITDKFGNTYTMEFNNLQVTKIVAGDDTYTLEYKDGTILDKIYKNGTITLERNVFIDISNQVEYYTLFLTNPVLPKNFYDEDVAIEYRYHSNNEPFYVTAMANNQQVDIDIIVKTATTTKTRTVAAWIMGTTPQAIADTIALKLERDINIGFSRNSTSRMYMNMDTIEEITGTNAISIEAINNLNIDDKYLIVTTPVANNSSINSYEVTYTYTKASVTNALMFQSGEYYVKNDDVYSKAISYSAGTEYYTRETTYTKVTDKSSYKADGIYAERYKLFERVSYSISDGFAEMRIILTDSNNVEYEKIIYAQLPRISEQRYIELVKSEIGQIFFSTGTENKYQLPNAADLARFDVKAVSYTPVVATNGNYETTSVFTIDSNYVMTNVSAQTSSEYYLSVTLTLKDDKQVTFLTDKIALTTATTGGDGENDYQSSLFEEDFNKISTFIGLSDDFILNGNVYFYLEIINNNDSNEIKNASNHVYLGLYKKILSYTASDIPTDSTYFYIDTTANKLTKVYIDSTHPVPSGNVPLYTEPSDGDIVVGTNYRMVFLTDSTYIPTTSTNVKVRAYITDSNTLDTAAKLKAQALEASSIDLYEGLYDSKGNPIYEISNGTITYAIEYNFTSAGATPTAVYEKNSDGTFTLIPSGTRKNITGFYCMGYVFNKIEEGAKVYLDNGFYSSEVMFGNSLTTYVDDKVTYTIAYYDYDKTENSNYQKYGPAKINKIVIDMTGNEVYYYKSGDSFIKITGNYTLLDGDNYYGVYESNGAIVTDLVFSNSSFKLSYNDGECVGVKVNYTTANANSVNKYYRIKSQQTTFYDIEHKVITIYAQDYSFTVPGIYNPSDFNWDGTNAVNLTGEELDNSSYASNTYDLYEKLMELYGYDNGDGHYGYLEINGFNYFLLVDYLEDAINFGSASHTYVTPTSYSELITYYKETDGVYSVASDVTESNYSSFYVISNTSYLPIDCDGKYVYAANLEKCPNIEGIYIKNAAFSNDTVTNYNISNIDSLANGTSIISNPTVGEKIYDITSNTELASGLYVYAKSKYPVTIDGYIGDTNYGTGAVKTVNGITYTRRLKFGGTASFDSGSERRIARIDISSNTKTLLQVVLASSNNSQNRYLNIADGFGKNYLVGRLVASMGGTATIESFVYEGSSNYLYLYCDDGPVNIYAIYVYDITDTNDTLKDAGFGGTLKDLYLEDIKGISNIQYSFENYTELLNLTIKNSNIVVMPYIYRKLDTINLSNNLISNIENISLGVSLKNINLSNNIIKSFEPLRAIKNLNSLYVAGNNSNSIALVDGTEMYLYGIPRQENVYDPSTKLNVLRDKGLINITNLIQVCDNNHNLDKTNTDFYEYLFETYNSGDNQYLYAAYTANAISYSYSHSDGLAIDLSLIKKAGYTTNVYISNAGNSYDKITPTASAQYGVSGAYYAASSSQAGYEYVLISVTKGSYTVYREIYITTD